MATRTRRHLHGRARWADLAGEQARLVKTVKVRHVLAGAVGSDRRLLGFKPSYSKGCDGVAIDWVTGRSSERNMALRKDARVSDPRLNVQSGHGKLYPKLSIRRVTS